VTSGDFHNTGPCNEDDAKCGPDYDFGASAILVRLGGRDLLLAGQKSGIVYALDPDAQGKILWQERVGTGGITGGVQWGMAAMNKTFTPRSPTSSPCRINPTPEERLSEAQISIP